MLAARLREDALVLMNFLQLSGNNERAGIIADKKSFHTRQKFDKN
jgi:hypothetical protein